MSQPRGQARVQAGGRLLRNGRAGGNRRSLGDRHGFAQKMVMTACRDRRVSVACVSTPTPSRSG